MRNIASIFLMRLMLVVLLSLSMAAGLTACGKRGDPYRPSDVTTPAS
jgi:predicted small lipoprotein YifL